MAATAEWDIPFALTSPYGTLVLNGPVSDGPRYLLVPQACQMGAELRIETDNVPQGDGSILHHRFETGYACVLAVELWDGDAFACGEVAREMVDVLNLHVRGLLNAGDNEGRLIWTPSGAVNRMLDDIRQAARLQVGLNDAGCTVATFAVDTQYPYAQNEAEETPASIADGATATLTNSGTTDYYPVMRVHGPAVEFNLFHDTLSTVLHWDTAYPGTPPIPGGSYAEVDFFRNTIYMNGDEDNLLSGLDMLSSSFWPLEPGDNDVTVVIFGGGASADILWASAWD